MLPGPDSNELNTPVPPIPRTVEDLTTDKGKLSDVVSKSELSSLVLSQIKRGKASPKPTSTTEDGVVIISSESTKEKLSRLVPNILNIPSQMETDTTVPDSSSFTLVTAAQSTTVSP